MANKKKKAVKKAVAAGKPAVVAVNKGFTPNITGLAVTAGLVAVLLVFVFIEFFGGKITLKNFAGKAPGAAAGSDRSGRPVFINGWSSFQHGGLTSIRFFNGRLYVIDNERKQIFAYNAADGVFLNKWDGCSSVVEDSKGRVMILYPDGRVEIYVEGKKQKDEAKLADLPGGWWIDIDGAGNIYAVSPQAGKIIKYGPNFEKISEIGGPGGSKDKFRSLGKIFVSGNEIYCMDTPEKQPGREIKVFSTEGKFLRSWSVKGLKVFSHLNNLAVMPDGSSYMNSFEESKVIAMNKNGKLLGSFTSDVNDSIRIAYPASICDGRGNGYFYVPTFKIACFSPGRF